MGRKSRSIAKVFLWCCVLILLADCTSARRETGPGLSDVKTGKFAGEMARLEEIAKNDPDPFARAEAHLSRARLYSSYKNPNPDYRQALRELEKYLSFNPPKGKTVEIRNWLAILRELDRVKKENNDLKDILERLKNLDITIEEKRKQVK
jgi:hypothetical protein